MRNLTLLTVLLALCFVCTGQLSAREVTIIGKVSVTTDSDGIIAGVTVESKGQTYICVVDDNARRMGGTMKDKDAKVIGNLTEEDGKKTLEVLVYMDTDVEEDVEPITKDDEDDDEGEDDDDEDKEEEEDDENKDDDDKE